MPEQHRMGHAAHLDKPSCSSALPHTIALAPHESFEQRSALVDVFPARRRDRHDLLRGVYQGRVCVRGRRSRARSTDLS